jgi:Putative zinc-finger
MPSRQVLHTTRIVVVAGLAVNAWVHLDLASTYAEAGGVINEGVLFCAEAVAAMLAALVVAIYGSRISYLAGFGVAASALATMLVSRYVDLGAIGAFPDLYDPVWFGEKILAAVAEGLASLAALIGFILAGIGAKAAFQTCREPLEPAWTQEYLLASGLKRVNRLNAAPRQSVIQARANKGVRPGAWQQLQGPVRQRVLHFAGRHNGRHGGRITAAGSPQPAKPGGGYSYPAAVTPTRLAARLGTEAEPRTGPVPGRACGRRGENMGQACARWRGEIGAYIVGALDAGAAAAVRRHLRTCPTCRAAYEDLIPVRDWLTRLTPG